MEKEDLEFLINNCSISYYGSRALQETNICVMGTCVRVDKAGTFNGREYKAKDIIAKYDKSNHGFGSWHPEIWELYLPKEIQVVDGYRLVRADPIDASS